MSEEDGAIKNATYTLINEGLKSIEFELEITFAKEGGEKSKYFKGKIAIPSIYEEKQRAFVLEETGNKSESSFIQE